MEVAEVAQADTGLHHEEQYLADQMTDFKFLLLIVWKVQTEQIISFQDSFGESILYFRISITLLMHMKTV